MSEVPVYDKVKYYLDNYGQVGVDEQRAVENFVICEPDYMVPTLVSQLHAISKGLYNEENMDQILGRNRKVKHGSYDNWARLMVLWINESRKRP